MGVETIVGQVAVVGGQLDSQAAGILVDERSSPIARGRGRGALYIQVEVLEDRVEGQIVASRIAEIVRDTYFRQRGSVTAGLQRAINLANNLLCDENQNSIPGERWTAGISCAVLRAGDLFIAQAGPAALLVAGEGQVSRYPDISPWLGDVPLDVTNAALGTAFALGRQRTVQVDLFHSQVSSGDTFLLVGSKVAREIDPQAWINILTANPSGAVLHELVAAAGGLDLEALMVRLGEEPLAEVPIQVPPVADVQPPQLAPVPSASIWQKAGLSRWVQRSPMLGRNLAKRAGYSVLARKVGHGLAVLGATLLGFLKGMVPGPSRPRAAASGDAAASGGVPELEPWMPPAGPRAPRTRSDFIRGLLAMVAIAIPLAVAGFVGFSLYERGQAQSVEVDSLWLDAQALWVQAQATADRSTLRDTLIRTKDTLVQLLQRKPDHAEAAGMLEEVEAYLEEGLQVKRIHWAGALRAYPEDAILSRVVVAGEHVFVMDRKANVVYHHRLDELQQALLPDTLDTVIIRKGQQVDDVLVSDLIDMTWIGKGYGRQTEGLVILETGGWLLEYDPTSGDLKPLRLTLSEPWQAPKRVGSHTGRFYLLDSQAGRIWRFIPTEDGYSEPPDDWLQESADLSGVMDMAIGDSIYLLNVDGKLRKYSNGKVDTFDMSNWDTPPNNASALFTRPPAETRWVYVADRGNSRIVQCSKEGGFERQFRLAEADVDEEGDPLVSVTSLVVDEKGLRGPRAYLLAGNRLYLIVLPDLAS